MFLVRSLAAAALAVLPVAGLGAELPRLADQPSTAEQSIRQTLDGPVKESLPATRLSDLVEYLSAEYHIEVQLDGRAVSEGLVHPQDMVSMNVQGIRLRTALELALRPLGLTWTIYDDVLLITTADEADRLLVVKVYDVHDLLRRGDPRNGDCESLIELVTSIVAPESWDEVGGPGAIQEYHGANHAALAISQTPRAHEEIEGLFDSLRRIDGGRTSTNESLRNDALRPHSLTGSSNRLEAVPRSGRRARVYQAADWLTPQLHP